MVNEEEGVQAGSESITFLYKLAPDFCPKSYGFNVAKLAGLPDKVGCIYVIIIIVFHVQQGDSALKIGCLLLA